MKKSFSISEAISFGWHTFKSNWKFWIIAFIIFAAGSSYSTSGPGSFAISGLSSGIVAAMRGAAYNQEDLLEYPIDPDLYLEKRDNDISSIIPTGKGKLDKNVLGSAVGFDEAYLVPEPTVGPAIILLGMILLIILSIPFLILSGIFMLVSIAFRMGFINLTLDAARKNDVYYKTILNQLSLKKALKLLIAEFFVGLLVFFGLMLLIIPGIIFAFKYMFVPYVIVDQEKPSIREALRKSGKITKGVRFKLFLFSIISILVLFVGLLALGVGVIVAAIVLALATSHVYNILAQDEIKRAQEEIPVPLPPSTLEGTVVESSILSEVPASTSGL